MKLTRFYPLLLILVMCSLLSCDDTNSINCPKRWTFYNNQNLTSNFEGSGTLFLGSNSLSAGVPPSTILYNDTISGDFELVLNYEGLFYTSPGLGFYIGLSATAINGGDNYLSARIGTTLTPSLPTGVLHIGAIIDSLGNAPSSSNGVYTQATGNLGEFRIRRVGSNVEVISSTGNSGNLVTYSKPFFTSDIVFGIVYGSNYPNTPPYTSSVRLTNFRYYRGTTLADGDGFDCNSFN